MQTTSVWKKAVSIGLILWMGFAVAACSHYRYATIDPRSHDIQREFGVGDTVKIVTKDGRDVEFKVALVTSEAIAGEGQRVRFSEIAKLEKEILQTSSSPLVVEGVSDVVGIAYVAHKVAYIAYWVVLGVAAYVLILFF